MSNRKDRLEKEILPLLEDIASTIKDISVAGLATIDRDEIAHLKKVFKYIYEMLKSLDPDFIPIRTIDATKTSLQNIAANLRSYLTSPYIGYITSVNEDYLDTLLRDLMPFFFYKGKIAESLEKALNEYSTTISEHASSYLNEVKQASITAQESLENIEDIASDATNKQELFTKYSNDIFGKEGLKNKISELVTNFEKKSQDINKLHQNIFDEDDGIEVKINEYFSNGKEQNDNLNNLTKNSAKILEEIKAFHKDVFGEEDEYGTLKGGLKNELLERKSELDEFKTEQQKRYDELNSQIESLLPGATSAGLSSAYAGMHIYFSREVRKYGLFFITSIVLLFSIIVGVNLYPHEKSIIQELPTIQLNIVKNNMENDKLSNNIDLKSIIPNNASSLGIQEYSLGNKAISILDSLIYKLPFILPAIWLVFFFSRRRSEAQRLAQEYAHKEVLAKSYESYKQQIEKLSEEEQNKLLPILMENMLKAIALNPAETLDKNHKEPTPIEEVIKKKEFWDFIEKIKNFMPKKEG